MMKKINVLLVDDHEVVRAGFKILLSSQADIGTITETDRGESVVKRYLIDQPDVIVMDLSMPGIGGMEAIRRAVKADDEAKILVYSIHDEAIYVDRAIQAGAVGYISKNSAASTLAEAVRHVAAGDRYIEPGLLPERYDVRKADNEHKDITELLTPREFDVFCRLAKGLNAHAISDEMHLGYKTVANYSTQIKNKLNVSTTAELTNIALVSGVLKANA
jgi:DNA-binding NarL/FixJ family response regulator